jgi:hypothetical protein
MEGGAQVTFNSQLSGTPRGRRYGCEIAIAFALEKNRRADHRHSTD